jgi:hypothetical protein
LVGEANKLVEVFNMLKLAWYQTTCSVSMLWRRRVCVDVGLWILVVYGCHGKKRNEQLNRFYALMLVPLQDAPEY